MNNGGNPKNKYGFKVSKNNLKTKTMSLTFFLIKNVIVNIDYWVLLVFAIVLVILLIIIHFDHLP